MAQPKALYALINGIAKREYHGEASITTEFLRAELMPGMPAAGAESDAPFNHAKMRKMPEIDANFNINIVA